MLRSTSLVSTTWYYYHYDDHGESSGNVERIVTQQATGPPAGTMSANEPAALWVSKLHRLNELFANGR